MKALVLGGTGFIGSHLVERLLKAEHEVVVYCRSVDMSMANPNVTYIQGDFSDSLRLSEALYNVDVVVHAISSTVPGTSNLDPISDIQQNLVGTANLLRLMVDSNVKRLVFFSLGGTVYGKPNIFPVLETHSLNPICSYGVVKVAIENYIGMYETLYGLKPLIIRAANPYGPRQGHAGVQGALATFLFNNMNRKTITIWGDGEVRRGYIYIDDFIDFCQVAIESEITGTFNVDSNLNHSLNELVNEIERVTNIKSDIEYKEKRDFDIKEMNLDITKAQTTFNWTPKYSIHDGISAFYKAIQ
jgi:UDP-glucose 4-epimerase